MDDDKDADPALTCWKCKGSGRKYSKKTKQYDGDPCKVCESSGKVRPSRKARANAARPGVIVELRGPLKTTSFLGPPAFGSRNGQRPSLELVRRGEILASLGCGDWRIYQLAAGHKLTVDDFICAWVAATEMRARGFGGEPRSGAFGKSALESTGEAEAKKVFRHADIGCGCGSVLMTLAWAFPGSIVSQGVEAQSVSFDLLKRGLLWNLGFDGTSPKDTVRVTLQDLRTWDGGDRAPYDLVTGTPPYFSEAKFTPSANHKQKVRCRVPTRGAAEDYVEAAARLLAPEGVFVMVEASHAENARAVVKAVERTHLKVVRRLDVVPRQGLPIRFSCWVITRSAENEVVSDAGEDATDTQASPSLQQHFETSELVLRLGREHGFKRSPEYVAAMESMGWVNYEEGKPGKRQKEQQSPSPSSKKQKGMETSTESSSKLEKKQRTR